MTSLLLRIFLAFATLYLSGCTTVTAPPPQNQTIAWEDRAHLLSRIQDWNLRAVVGIRTANDAGSLSMHWQQSNQNYTLLLLGPLGTNTYKLSGKPGKVELDTPHGEKYFASTPEQLLAAQTGWNLPVSYLYYWVRGLPVPNMPAQKTFDAFHHLSQLSQQGWQVQFLRYTATTRGDLPDKIFIVSRNLTVKIVINQWQL